MAVGDFTAVNGDQAYGIAYYNGNSWCSMPHLDLYTYTKPWPTPTTNFPLNNLEGSSAGSAAAIFVSGNTFYVFGGCSSTSTPRFNKVGAETIGVAGIVKLQFTGSNFTIDNSLNYITRGFTSPNFEPNTNGFPAQSSKCPVTTLGSTKVRVTGNTFFVHPSVGSGNFVHRWRVGDGDWLRLTSNGLDIFNVTGNSVTFDVGAPAIGAAVLDFDIDGTNVVVVGQFNNTGNTTSGWDYLNVARCQNCDQTVVRFQKVVNWANILNFLNRPVTRIAVNNQNDFYISASFVNQDTNNAENHQFNPEQYYVYRVQSGNPAIIGQRFANYVPQSSPSSNNPTFHRLAWVNSRLYVFGVFSVYQQEFSAENNWPRHYLRKISNAVVYDGSSTFNDAFGGFVDYTQYNARNAFAISSGLQFVYVQGATSFYSVQNHGLVGYNTKNKQWVSLVDQRFSWVNANQYQDMAQDGPITAVHFIRKQRPNINDAILVGGHFDWYGSQFLASVAYYRLDSKSFEQVGGGLYYSENSGYFQGDRVRPVYTAGIVFDLAEIGDFFYAAGRFTKNINGECTSNVARYNIVNGGSWSSLAGGCNGVVWDLLEDGDDLYVGGEFTSCSGVPGTRRIAKYDTKKNTFHALNTGFADGRVYAMNRFRGDLYVGGSFTTAPASLRFSSSRTGLYRWDGEEWEPVYGRCKTDCGANEFNVVLSLGQDPLSRAVSGTVSSLRNVGARKLYIQAGNLYRYDGRYIERYGNAAAGTCVKQGCLASNNSRIIGAGWSSAASDSYNNNYQMYDPELENWVDTFTGFDAAPYVVASANFITFSVLCFFIIALFAF